MRVALQEETIPRWTATSVMRRDYLDLLGDYIPRGQQHFKLRLRSGCARLSTRSMAELREAARSGDTSALATLAGDLSVYER